MKTIAVVVTLAVAVLTVVGATTTHGTSASTCGPSTNQEMTVLLSFAQHITGPSFAANRAALHIPTIDSASVRVVTADSVCNLAAATINRERGGIDSTRIIYLLDLGGKAYWAKDPNVRGGEYVQTFILDSSLTRVLAHALQ